MESSKFKEFLKEIESPQNSRFLYGICSPEWSLVQLFKKRVQSFAQRIDPSCRLVMWHASEVTEELLDKTFLNCDLFSSFEFIWIRDLQLLENKTAVLERLTRYLAQSSEERVVLLSATKWDKRKKQNKQLLELFPWVDLPAVSLAQVSGWIVLLAQELGLNLAPNALDLLKDCYGSQLTMLYQDLQKWQVFWGDKTPALIKAENLRDLATQSTTESVFELITQWFQKDLSGFVSNLKKVLESMDSELIFLSLLYRNLNQLSVLQKSLKKGISGKKELQEETGIAPYFLGPQIELAKNVSESELQTQLVKVNQLYRDCMFQSKHISPRTQILNVLLNHSF